MQAAGLRCVSAHYGLGLLRPHLDEILSFCKSLGVGYVVCSSPMHQKEGAQGAAHAGRMALERRPVQPDRRPGRGCGYAFAYHNHYEEFGAIDGILPLTSC